MKKVVAVKVIFRFNDPDEEGPLSDGEALQMAKEQLSPSITDDWRADWTNASVYKEE